MPQHPKPGPVDVDNLPHILTVEEVSACLRISPYHVRKSVRDGTLRAHRWGNQLRFPAIYIKEILFGQEQQSIENELNAESEQQSGISGSDSIRVMKRTA